MAFLEWEASSALQELAAQSAGAAANALQRTGALEVITHEAVAAAIGLERQRQLFGCDDDGESCLVDLAGALDVDYLLMGRIGQAEDGGGVVYSAQLALVDARSGRRLGSEQTLASTPAALLRAVPELAASVVEPLLAPLRGGLLLSVSEEGAEVRVGGRLMGTTPLGGQVPLSPGPHLVEVNKEGFLPFRRELELGPREVLEERVTLAPSPDFIDRYERRNGRLRTGAYIASGLTMAGVGATLLFQQRAQTLYGASDQEGTFLFHRARITGGDHEADRAHWNQASQLRSRIEQQERLSLFAGGVAAAAGVTAVTLWLWGDDPGRYARFRQLQVAVTPSGSQVAVGGAF